MILSQYLNFQAITSRSPFQGGVGLIASLNYKLESDDYDLAKFRRKLSQVNEKIITIKRPLEDNQAKIEALREAQANKSTWWRARSLVR